MQISPIKSHFLCRYHLNNNIKNNYKQLSYNNIRDSFYSNSVQKTKNTSLNISFTHRKKPAYLVDSEGNYEKYFGLKECAIDLNIRTNSISAVLKNRSKSAKGYFFIKTNDVEKLDDSGKVVADEDSIEKFYLEMVERKKQ